MLSVVILAKFWMQLKTMSWIDEKILCSRAVTERGTVSIGGVEIQYSGRREG